MAYLGIGENQLEILDNEQNRNLVKHKILADYIDKFVPTNQDDIHKKMVHILDVILGSMKLHQLLVLTADDCDVLIWNKLFDYLKDNVCEITFAAKRFFEVGGDAQLNEDEYWNEYHIMLGFIPEKTREFVAAFCDRNEWQKLTDNVAGYIKAVVPTKCKWVAFSDDGAYEDISKGTFDSEKDCYNDMRRAALEKMKWNTEFDEDLVPENGVDNFIGYVVKFSQNMIIHQSFSGVYVYKIVGENEVVKHDDIFTDEFKKWLREYLQVEIY